MLGTVKVVTPGVANDVLELDGGVAAADGRGVHPRGRSRRGPYPGRRGIRRVMQLDVFTLVPHAFAWLTEQRPVATVLGARARPAALLLPRLRRRCGTAQVDDEPYGGGAGMVLRVDVVAAALDAVYGGAPAQPVIALTRRGAS